MSYIHYTMFRVLFNVMSNKLLSKDVKTRLRRAAKVGRDEESCKQFVCELDNTW